jgi:RsiW-degrading membrane proteinase PrsW (M82 family)
VLVFVNVALAEEAGRLCVLAPFSLIAKSILARRANAPDAAALPEQAPAAGGRFSAAAGLAVGLGFALVESVSYGGAGFSAALLRVLSAVPLHGSCGARVGAAAANFRTSPLSAAVSFLSAVFIHGLYDLILIRGSPPLLAVIIALAAFVSSARRLSARL